jgi:hypothetical protein
MYEICLKTFLGTVGKIAYLKGWKLGLFLKFGQFTSRIR